MIKVLRIQDDNGQYKDKDGVRYTLIYGAYAVGPRAKDFVEFDTLEDALETYGLQEVENGGHD